MQNKNDILPLAAWRENRRWRTLPYCQGRWKGPHGLTRYISDRDYSVIAYLHEGELVRGANESLSGCFLYQETASHFYGPSAGMASPNLCDKTLTDLLRRSAAWPATSWVLTSEVAA